MDIIERKYVYELKQYERKGMNLSYHFVDFYLNGYLEDSIIVYENHTNSELERLFNVFLARKNKEYDFLDSTERQMNDYFLRKKGNLNYLIDSLRSKMGIERFNKHYERKCYFLMYTSDEFDIEVQETFHISERYNPLMCLKMAYDFGKKTGNSFRILLSDHITEVDKIKPHTRLFICE